MISKKADNVNIDKRRREIFLVAIVIILSSLVALLSWRTIASDIDTSAMIEDLIENVNLEELHKDDDLVSAISKTDKPVEITNIKNEDNLTESMINQPQEVNLNIGAEKDDIKEEEKKEEEPLLDVFDADDIIGYEELEDLPQFPGGPTAFTQWINENLKYPENARNRKTEGRVIIRFVVDTEGEPKNLEIVQTTTQLFGNAVMNVMKKMPKWTPGTYGGKPCNALLEVPINFCLQ